MSSDMIRDWAGRS